MRRRWAWILTVPTRLQVVGSPRHRRTFISQYQAVWRPLRNRTARGRDHEAEERAVMSASDRRSAVCAKI